MILELIMIIFSALCMISSLIAFESGILVLRLNRHRSINIVYTVFSLDFVLVCLFFNQYVTSPVHGIALFWNHMMAFPAALYPSFMLHFTILLISKNEQMKNKWLLPAIYLPSILIGLMVILGQSIQDVIMTPWGWENYSSSANFWLNSSFVIFIILCLISLLLVLYRYLNPFGKRNRNQIRPIMYSLLTGTIGWIISLSLYYTGEGPLQSIVSNIAFLIIVTPLLIGVRWAIAKYNLMTLAPDRQAAELISGIEEPVFVLDMSGKVIFQNTAAHKLAMSAEMTDGYIICNLFLSGQRLRKELYEITTGTSTGNYLRMTVRNTHQNRTSYILQLQGIKNELDEYIGAICSAIEEKSFGDFQNRFGITPREIDVLYLSVAGYTNKEIAQELNISQRTVEHHHENIYNKLGINNKLELYNISLKYQIISN